MKYTIGITTFKHRFDTYFKPLLKSIKEYAPDIEVIVGINGEHNEDFDNSYRKNILKFISEFDNVYPIVYTSFRSLSKLWNNIILNSTNDFTLMLNDDISINRPESLAAIDYLVNNINTSFKINSSWSHCMLKKSEVMEVGYFNESLLGIGEEDGEFEHRYIKILNKEFMNAGIPFMINHVDMSYAPKNVREIDNNDGKYSAFNREMMYNELYIVDKENGVRRGICPHPLSELNPIKEQYPYEKFYLENRHRL